MYIGGGGEFSQHLKTHIAHNTDFYYKIEKITVQDLTYLWTFLFRRKISNAVYVYKMVIFRFCKGHVF